MTERSHNYQKACNFFQFELYLYVCSMYYVLLSPLLKFLNFLSIFKKLKKFSCFLTFVKVPSNVYNFETYGHMQKDFEAKMGQKLVKKLAKNW